jgi:hypothetical protein
MLIDCEGCETTNSKYQRNDDLCRLPGIHHPSHGQGKEDGNARGGEQYVANPVKLFSGGSERTNSTYLFGCPMTHNREKTRKGGAREGKVEVKDPSPSIMINDHSAEDGPGYQP